MTNLFERYFILGGDRDQLVASFEVKKTHSEEFGEKDRMMTQGQVALHYNLPYDHPSVKGLCEAAKHRGAFRRHPARPLDEELMLYDVLDEITKTKKDTLLASVKALNTRTLVMTQEDTSQSMCT